MGLGIFLAALSAVFAGLFGLQYTTMRRYSVSNASFLSVMFATIIVPPAFVSYVCPGWMDAIRLAVERDGWQPLLITMACGFGWGMGAITYAYGFNILGMALAAAMIKGISIAVGSGYTLWMKIELVSRVSLAITVAGLAVLLVGTALGGKAGVMRERELEALGKIEGRAKHERTARMFLLGMLSCLLSGVFSACVALGWAEGEPIGTAMQEVASGTLPQWQAEFVRWIPIYFGGFLSILVFMGGEMLRSGDWRNYAAAGSGRDALIASSMGVVHFGAHLTFGLCTYFLGPALGNSVGFSLHIALALLVAAAIGFYNGEWSEASRRAIAWIWLSIGVLVVAVVILAYGVYVQVRYEQKTIVDPPEIGVGVDAALPYE